MISPCRGPGNRRQGFRTMASMPESVARFRIVYTGHVQGVGFRVTARDTARGFAVTGWVRNEPDGTVMMEVQGSAAEVEACLERLRARMQRHIARENRLSISPRNEEAGFTIER